MEDAKTGRARIRVYREGLEEVIEALGKHVEDLLDGRDTVRGTGADPVNRFNARIKATRRVLDEAIRTQAEQGWQEAHSGQQERSDT
ncbi:MAG TPA: hypothetical protein VFX15_03040 [Actinomycetes bacterium]|nr:hypothetical protein [Actinomycetes bacterium]